MPRPTWTGSCRWTGHRGLSRRPARARRAALHALRAAGKPLARCHPPRRRGGTEWHRVAHLGGVRISWSGAVLPAASGCCRHACRPRGPRGLLARSACYFSLQEARLRRPASSWRVGHRATPDHRVRNICLHRRGEEGKGRMQPGRERGRGGWTQQPTRLYVRVWKPMWSPRLAREAKAAGEGLGRGRG